MVSQALKWIFVAIATMFVSSAWACFPAPDAKPVHEVSIVDLSLDRRRATVVFESEAFAIHVAAEALLAILSKPNMDVATPNDLANALRSKMPLAKELTTTDLLHAAFSDAAKQRMPFDGFVIQSNVKLRHAFAGLLQQGAAHVVDTSSGEALANVKLDKFKEICHGGRRFTNARDQEILRIVDWIS
jgi:hypothetical protein